MNATPAMDAVIAARKALTEAENAAKAEVDAARKLEQEERTAKMNERIAEARENDYDFTVGDNSDYIGVKGNWGGVNLELVEYLNTQFSYFMFKEQALEFHARLGELLREIK